jgi:hypothetical protein
VKHPEPSPDGAGPQAMDHVPAAGAHRLGGLLGATD